MLAFPCLADDRAIDFNRDIRPLLSDNCYACHGPDEEQRTGGFRLDVKASVFGEAKSGSRPIVPGDVDASEILRRLATDDVDLRMPPAESGKPLTPEQIERFRQWIQQGAEWQEHWSLVPPQPAMLPTLENDSWARNPIDYFLLARLEKEGFRPSPEADKVTLIRRVTLDLTGLPPTAAEVTDFLTDNSPDSYETVVDRLLRSERYGEHMARFWLDAARYGDTHGLHLDNYREIWPYRDWVVKAFNDNLPYDQFTIQQLAGDLLPDPTKDQLVATGFCRSNVSTNEGGSIKEEVYVRNVVDRTVTFGTVFMGLTLECTRCHDHKFDPFTMDDFYSMFAYFNSIDGSPLDGNRRDHAPVLRVPSAEQQQQLDDYDPQIAATEKKLQEPWPEIDALQSTWEQHLTALVDTPAGDGQLTSPATSQDFVRLGTWYTVGPFSESPRYIFLRKLGPEKRTVNLAEEFRLGTGDTIKWVRRPEWKDGQPHHGLPGDTAANFLFRTVTCRSAQKVTISLGSDDGLQVYLNNEQVLANDTKRTVAADQEKVELSLVEGENQLLVKIVNLGDESGFYFSMDAEQPIVSPDIVEIAGIPNDKRSNEQAKTISEFFRNDIAKSEALQEVQENLEQLRTVRAKVDRQVPTTLIWREKKEPSPAHYLKRGEYDQPGHLVSRRTPTSLPPMKDELPKNRLGLAQWLIDPGHPLTARVAVNRFWLQLFGIGIVKTAEDFGSQGEMPSHPELLDWLALQFIADGWDIKATMKRMVLSSTYRQSSRRTPELQQRDPENRLLSRGPRFRLDAEMLRDQVLFVSGLLVEKIGGPSVRPPQPDGLWFAVGYSGSDTVRFVSDKGRDKVHRRTLYTFIKRTSPPPQMSIVDAPSREACVMRRERTNTPLMSLMLFNDPQYVEAARALAERTMREGGDNTESRAQFMFHTCTCRLPTHEERNDLIKAFGEELDQYISDIDAARELVAIGETTPDNQLDTSELAAWTVIANMLLCTDEVVTKN